MSRMRLAVVLAVVVVVLLWAFGRRGVAETVGPAPTVAAAPTRAPPRSHPAHHAAPAPAEPQAAAAAAATPEVPQTEVCHKRGLLLDGAPQVVWVDDSGRHCDPDGALLAMDVVDEHGLAADDAWVVPVGCEGLEPGPPRVTRIPTGTCTVRAMRRDGALFARSEPVTVDVTTDDTAYILLELASTRTGGIGVRFQPDEHGIRVLYVVEGSPADEAGLHVGDLVLDVGGEPTAGMDPDTFVERMTGAEGTDVTFTVGWSDDTGLVEETVTVIRRFLDG